MVQGNVLIESQLLIIYFWCNIASVFELSQAPTEDEGFLMKVLKNSKLFMQSQWVVTPSLFLSFFPLPNGKLHGIVFY